MEFGVRELIQFGTLLASLAGAFAVVKSQVSRLIEDIAKLQSYANKLENRLEIIEKGSEFVKVELIDLDNKVKVERLNKKIYLQAGLFSDEKNANNLIEKIKKLGVVNNENIKKIKSENQFQVLIGPFEDKQEAKIKKDQLSENFFINGFIVKI